MIDWQKKSITKLQEPRTVKKIVQIDDHIWMAFSGLTADGRILANKARIECQSYRLNYDDAPPIVTLHTDHRTILPSMSVRPSRSTLRKEALGLSVFPVLLPDLTRRDCQDCLQLILQVGILCDLGSCSEWRANSVGRNSKQVCEYLEKNFKEDMTREEAMKLAVKALMDVVESGNKNIELLVVTKNEARHLLDAEIEQLITSLK